MDYDLEVWAEWILSSKVRAFHPTPEKKLKQLPLLPEYFLVPDFLSAELQQAKKGR